MVHGWPACGVHTGLSSVVWNPGALQHVATTVGACPCPLSRAPDRRSAPAAPTRQHVALVLADDHSHGLQVHHQRLWPDEHRRGEGDGHLQQGRKAGWARIVCRSMQLAGQGPFEQPCQSQGDTRTTPFQAACPLSRAHREVHLPLGPAAAGLGSAHPAPAVQRRGHLPGSCKPTTGCQPTPAAKLDMT